MFDGNHRTRRNNINLSGRRQVRRTGTTAASNSNKSTAGITTTCTSNTKSSIILESKLRREERLENQRRKNAAITIQKQWKGFRCRMELVQQYIQFIQSSSSSSSSSSNNNTRTSSAASSSSSSNNNTTSTTCTTILPVHHVRTRCNSKFKFIISLLSPTLSPLIYKYWHRSQKEFYNMNGQRIISTSPGGTCKNDCDKHNKDFIIADLLLSALVTPEFLGNMCMPQSFGTYSHTDADPFLKDTQMQGDEQIQFTNDYDAIKQVAYRIRRIVKHCLLFFQSFLHQHQYQNNKINYQHVQSLASSVLQLLHHIILQYSHILHIIIPTGEGVGMLYSCSFSMNACSETEVIQLLAICSQAYYHALALATSNTYTTSIYSSTTLINLPLLYNITRQLMLLTCNTYTKAVTYTATLPSSSLQPINLLSFILLGIDLQPLLSNNKHASTTAHTSTASYSPLNIFSECAQLYVSKMSTKCCNDNTDCDNNDSINNNINFMYFLFESLNTIVSITNMQQPLLIVQLMNGHEITFIKNAFTLLETNTVMHRNNDESKTSLCYIIIQLLSLFLGLNVNVEPHASTLNTSENQQKMLHTSNQSLALNILIGLIAFGESINASNNEDYDDNKASEIDDEEALEEEFNRNDDDLEVCENVHNEFHYDTKLMTNHNDVSKDCEQHFRSIKVSSTYFKSNLNLAKNKQLKRQNFLTVVMLDQLYRSHINCARQDLYKYLKILPKEERLQLIDVARMIGTGDYFLNWALLLFPNHERMKKQKIFRSTIGSFNDDDDDAKMINLDEEPAQTLEQLQDSLVSVLSNAISYCSGIKARNCALSPCLSKLAFQSQWIEQLWQYVKKQIYILEEVKDAKKYSKQLIKAYSASSTFFDLFAHNLLPMDDEEFLLTYTTNNINKRPRSSILASEVIEMMNSNLFKLYWVRPVLKSDVMLPITNILFDSLDALESCQRARFLLSGTKLWNALHQRWSRLFTTAKFCSDECWYFSRLVTRGNDEDGAVFGTRTEDTQDVEMGDNDDNSIGSTEGSMDFSSYRNTVTAADKDNDVLASSFKDPKMARILASVPQALPFERRVKLFNSLLTANLSQVQDESQAARNMVVSMLNGEEGAQFEGRIKAEIHRDRLYDDSMNQLNKLGSKLRKKVAVTFTNQVGALEAGIDGGGLFREFLDDLIKDAFHPQKRHGNIGGPLFTVSPLQTLSVNTNIAPTPEVLNHYRFLGRILGKAVYESLLVEVQFSKPFLNQLLGQLNTLDDLKFVDPEYYKHLSNLRHMSSKEIDDLGLTFELTHHTESIEGRIVRSVELIPGGSNENVTKQNVIRYVHLVANRRLNVDSAKQTLSFLQGFQDLINPSWVRLFSPYELQRLISGDDTVKGFDVSGLKEAMQYGGGYHISQQPIQWFWEIIDEMTVDQQRNFLRFMTSCSRQPLLGFKSLAPLPCIHQVRLSEEDNNLTDGRDLRLPTSATCMNLLKLPNYKSKELMKAKLLYAIESGAGFELS